MKNSFYWQATNIGLLLLIAFLWASAFGAMKIAVGETGPISLAATRSSIAALILLFILRLKGPIAWSILWRHFPQFLVVGGLGSALPFVLIPWAELRIESSLVALLMCVGPIATIAGAWAFGLERHISKRRILGILIGLSGTCLILAKGFSAIGQGYVIAQLVAVFASLCYVSGNLMVRKLSDIPPLTISALAISLAAILLWPLALIIETPSPSSWSPLSWQMVVWLGVMPTALAFSIRYYLIARAGASFTSYVGYLIPAMAMIIGATALGEAITSDKIIALGLILIGLLFAQTQKQSKS